MATKISTNLAYEKHFVPVGHDTLCLHRFHANENGIPVYMVHGAIENGRIFYSPSNKGLGPYLAKNGFDVFIVDMRGKGESFPKDFKKITYTQTDLITVDIPACLHKIQELTGKKEVHFVGHSWGGVWFYAFLARFNKEYTVLSQVLFGSKRRVSLKTLKRLVHIDLIWNLGGTLSRKLVGYAKFNRKIIGSEYEPGNLFREVNRWIYTKDWVSEVDQFNYKEALQKTTLPPTLHVTGIKDTVLGNPIDVELLIQEAGENQEVEFSILGKNYGNLVDYGHIDILTHKLAEEDHFPMVLEWLKKHSG